MGFGFMFLGYLLLLGTNFEMLGIPVDITPDFIGFLIMTHGFTTASKYCECFKITRILGTIGVPVAFAEMTLSVVIALNESTLPAAAVTVIYYTYLIFKLVFTLSLIWSLYQIAAQTGVEKLRKKSVRCAIYTVLLVYLSQFAGQLMGFLGIAVDAAVLSGVSMLCDAVYIIINATLIFGCYMWICLEGDEDMPDREDRKFKTPFDYFEKAQARDRAAKDEKAARKKKK